jgi:hypothetical protein
MHCVRFWALSAALLFTLPAQAQEELPDVSAPCPGAADVTTLLRDGQSGFWFPSETGRCSLARLASLPLFVRRVHLLEERLEVSGERHELMQRQVQLAEEGEQAAVGALEAAVRRAREAEEERDAWYRHPLLWAVVGVVVTVALEAVAIWGLSQVRL